MYDQWDSIGNIVKATTRLLENRGGEVGQAPDMFRGLITDLSVALRPWCPKSDLSIICRTHRRRCYLTPPREHARDPRVLHEGTGEICLSKRFLVRRESEYELDLMLSELVSDFT